MNTITGKTLRLILALCAWVVYPIAFFPVYQMIGEAAFVLSILFPGLAGRWLGVRRAAQFAIIQSLINVGLEFASGHRIPESVGSPIIGFVVMLLVGGTIGRLRDLSLELKNEVAEHNQAEKELRQAEEKYRGIFESAIEGIFQTSREGRFITANSALAHMLGYESPEELITSVSDIEHQLYVDPNGRNELKRKIEEQDTLRGYETKFYRKDGSEIWVAINVKPVRDSKGIILHFDGTNEDITERKKIEEELKRSETQLATAQEMSGLGSWDADLITKTVSWSSHLYHIMGLQPTEFKVSLEIYIETIHPDDRERIRNIIEQAIMKHQEFTCEHRIIRRDGVMRIVSAKGFVSVDGFGRPVKVFGVVQDITERKQREEERERLIRELQESLASIKTLSGLLPICASCKKIRDDKGYWNQVEKYIIEHSEATFTHGVCPECFQKLYAEYAQPSKIGETKNDVTDNDRA